VAAIRWTAVLVVLVTIGVRVDGEPRSVAFELARPGQIVVQALINGSGPFPFLLDTGSSHSVVSESLAGSIGAAVIAKTLVSSPLAQDMRLVVRLDRVAIGPITATGVQASVLSRRKFDPEGRIQGLIGQDVLAAHRYTLDVRSRTLTWHDNPGTLPRGGSTLALEADGGRFLVRAPQRATTLRLVPDSGADGLVLFACGRALTVPAVLDGGWRNLATLTHEAGVRSIRVLELRLGSATLRDVPAVLIAAPAAPAASADGLLPLHLFDRVTFDGPGLRLIIDGG
jgi:hypothetical protein